MVSHSAYRTVAPGRLPSMHKGQAEILSSCYVQRFPDKEVDRHRFEIGRTAQMSGIHQDSGAVGNDHFAIPRLRWFRSFGQPPGRNKLRPVPERWF